MYSLFQLNKRNNSSNTRSRDVSLKVNQNRASTIEKYAKVNKMKKTKKGMRMIIMIEKTPEKEIKIK